MVGSPTEMVASFDNCRDPSAVLIGYKGLFRTRSRLSVPYLHKKTSFLHPVNATLSVVKPAATFYRNLLFSLFMVTVTSCS